MYAHERRNDFFQWGKYWVFPGGGQRDYGNQQWGNCVLPTLKLREKRFSTETLLAKCQIWKFTGDQGPFSPPDAHGYTSYLASMFAVNAWRATVDVGAVEL